MAALDRQVVVASSNSVVNMAAAVHPPRPARGSRYSSFYPPLPEPIPNVFEIDSAFQLQEYIALLIRKDIHNVGNIVSVPGRGENEMTSEDDRGVDEGCWIYEQLRYVVESL